MEMDEKLPFQIHGIVSSDSDSDIESKKEFDEKYYSLKPPPLDYETIKHNIVKIYPKEPSPVTNVWEERMKRMANNINNKGEQKTEKSEVAKIKRKRRKKPTSNRNVKQLSVKEAEEILGYNINYMADNTRAEKCFNIHDQFNAHGCSSKVSLHNKSVDNWHPLLTDTDINSLENKGNDAFVKTEAKKKRKKKAKTNSNNLKNKMLTEISTASSFVGIKEKSSSDASVRDIQLDIKELNKVNWELDKLKRRNFWHVGLNKHTIQMETERLKRKEKAMYKIWYKQGMAQRSNHFKDASVTQINKFDIIKDNSKSKTKARETPSIKNPENIQGKIKTNHSKKQNIKPIPIHINVEGILKTEQKSPIEIKGNTKKKKSKVTAICTETSKKTEDKIKTNIEIKNKTKKEKPKPKETRIKIPAYIQHKAKTNLGNKQDVKPHNQTNFKEVTKEGMKKITKSKDKFPGKSKKCVVNGEKTETKCRDEPVDIEMNHHLQYCKNNSRIENGTSKNVCVNTNNVIGESKCTGMMDNIFDKEFRDFIQNSYAYDNYDISFINNFNYEQIHQAFSTYQEKITTVKIESLSQENNIVSKDENKIKKKLELEQNNAGENKKLLHCLKNLSDDIKCYYYEFEGCNFQQYMDFRTRYLYTSLHKAVEVENGISGNKKSEKEQSKYNLISATKLNLNVNHLNQNNVLHQSLRNDSRYYYDYTGENFQPYMEFRERYLCMSLDKAAEANTAEVKIGTNVNQKSKKEESKYEVHVTDNQNNVVKNAVILHQNTKIESKEGIAENTNIVPITTQCAIQENYSDKAYINSQDCILPRKITDDNSYSTLLSKLVHLAVILLLAYFAKIVIKHIGQWLVEYYYICFIVIFCVYKM